MPNVTVQGKTLTCDRGTNLRKLLLENNIDLYNGAAKVINCHGFGSCGTCAVKITGSVANPKGKEKLRLSFPPHKLEKGLRLACQVVVNEDLEVQKANGFWGEGESVQW